MVHTEHTDPNGPFHWLFAAPDRLLVVGFLALVVVTAVELVLLLGPMLLDPPWLSVPTLLPEDPFVHSNRV